MGLFRLSLHHGGRMMNNTGKIMYEGGKVKDLSIDEDNWSFNECVARLKEIGCSEVVSMWYLIGGKSLNGIKMLQNEAGALEMRNLAKYNGVVQLWLEHPICEPPVNENHTSETGDVNKEGVCSDKDVNLTEKEVDDIMAEVIAEIEEYNSEELGEDQDVNKEGIDHMSKDLGRDDGVNRDGVDNMSEDLDARDIDIDEEIDTDIDREDICFGDSADEREDFGLFDNVHQIPGMVDKDGVEEPVKGKKNGKGKEKGKGKGKGKKKGKSVGGPHAARAYTFMSDQQKGLLPALEEIIPHVTHRFCVRHLYSNFRKKFPRQQLKELMWNAARATYVQEWERWMQEMRKVNEEAFKHLLKIPPRFWSKSRFTFEAKCDVLVNNMSETFNSVIVDMRAKPIYTMLEDIREYLMERWKENRIDAAELENPILPRIQKKLDKNKEYTKWWIPRFAGEKKFQVTNVNGKGEQFVVNLDATDCSCREWKLTGIPCTHAICCMNNMKMQPESFIPSYYRKDMYTSVYSHVVYPTNGDNLWPQSEYPDLLPPPIKRQPGRPKKNRRKEPDERHEGRSQGSVSRKGAVMKCSCCGTPGHNKAKCPLKPTETTHEGQSDPVTQDASGSQPPPTQNQTQPSSAPASKPGSTNTQTQPTAAQAGSTQTQPTAGAAPPTQTQQAAPETNMNRPKIACRRAKKKKT